ncbi:arabinosyltransferase domain-containing protein [Blastococcus sp. SYSU D00695]
MRVVAGDRAGAAEDPGERRRVRAAPLPLLLGLLAVVCALALPLAPVQMSTPTVSWPVEPTRPASTMLQLTGQQPASLDVSLSCAAVRAAARSGEGVVLSTLVPVAASAGTDGLVLTARDGEFLVVNRGRDLWREPVRDGACRYELTGTPSELVLRRDGEVLVVDPAGSRAAARAAQARAGGGEGSVLDVDPGADGDVLPDVDVLATDLTTLPGPDDLRVELAVDDQFDTTPAPLKRVLVALTLLAAAGALVALAREDRRARRGAAASEGDAAGDDAADGAASTARGPRVLTGLVDAAVVATMVLWLFLAPQSDDDGYYAAMARNAADEGFVGNYYQLLNQTFTPFTWFYRVLGWWQEVGDSPVVLRLPVLAVGLATWLVVRRAVTAPGAVPAAVARARRGRPAVLLLLAASFLAWWLPFGMGVRPEAVVGLLAGAALLGVLTGLRTGRLLPVGLAVAAAGLAAACHPTGLVALAPFLAALPPLVRLVGSGRTLLRRLTRAVLVVAPGAVASVAAFADGSLHDFLRGQQVFLSIAPQNTWWEEYQRYSALLGNGPMGSYAKRAAVLLALVCLVWFLVLAVAARARGVRLPPALVLSAQSLALAFLLLWASPSKWTHHFGALAGIGPVFLALLLAAAPGLVPQVTEGRRPAPATAVVLLGSGVVTFALAFRGPNSWPYTWLPGMPGAGEPPRIGPAPLGTLTVWAAVTVAAVAAAWLLGRRRGRPGPGAERVAVPLVLLFLLATVGFLVGSFGYAAVQTRDGWSPWADAVTDPLASDCGAAGAMQVLDVAAAAPAAVVAPAPEPGPGTASFTAGGGWPAASPPPDTGAAIPAWGSLTGPGRQPADASLVTPWFALPPAADGQALAVLAAGRLGGGNELRVEYGSGAGDPRVVSTQTLTDPEDSPVWRTLVLDAAPARDAGAGVVRLVADVRTAATGGWLAVTAPAAVPQRTLSDVLADREPVATAWQIAFVFPCQRQPAVRHGITEPVRAAVLWSEGGRTGGMDDATWQVHRGGLFAPVPRTSSITRLVAWFPDAPSVADVRVHLVDPPYPSRGYDLDVERVQRWGWAGPPG